MDRQMVDAYDTIIIKVVIKVINRSIKWRKNTRYETS